ncbi:MAG TPA: metal-sulfur cluster assembly factor [Candidatus Nanoarchaeia archaeon]|nr:metal-sulfur cluster assembly factor [Candidatus Nanoarchaeia archaeon]
MIQHKQVVETLKKINDPEIQLDVYTLGLIYNIEIVEDKVNLRMTFTSPMCPYGPWLMQDIKTKVGTIEGVKEVNIELVFEPVWQPSQEVKIMLGME